MQAGRYFLTSQFIDVFGPLPPEVVEAVTFFCLQGVEDEAEPSKFEDVVCPNCEDLEHLSFTLMEAVFNGLVAMP